MVTSPTEGGEGGGEGGGDGQSQSAPSQKNNEEEAAEGVFSQAVDGTAAPSDAAAAPAQRWPRIEEARPTDVDPRMWEGLFEWAVWKLSLLLGGAHQVAAFVRDQCDCTRWDALMTADLID